MALNNRNVEPSYYRRLARLPKEFSFQDLLKATDNFSKKLGRGGSGSVFEGFLKDGTPVAVKKVERSEYDRILFENEVSTIASVQHVNLVHLQGFCKHEIEKGGESFIVYDLLPNGSLDSWIFPQDGPNNRFLSWKRRYQVAVDVATALVYLHHYCTPPIIHFDVKPPNILLDENFRAVLADFGLSVVTRKDGSHPNRKMARGTRGYMAPEMVKDNQASSKSDMYSFGRVLLDILFGQVYVCYDITGKDIYNEKGNSLPEERAFRAFMREKLDNNEIKLLVDKRLKKVNEAEANTLVDVALRCTEEEPRRRPRDMRKVLQLLEQGQQDHDEDPLGDGNMLIVIFHGALLDASDISQHHEKICAELTVGKETRRTSYVSELTNPSWKGEFNFLLLTSSNIHTLYVKLLNIHNEPLANADISLLDLTERKKIKKTYEFEGDHLEGHIRIELQLRNTPQTTNYSQDAVHMLEAEEHVKTEATIDTFSGGGLAKEAEGKSLSEKAKEQNEVGVGVNEFDSETQIDKASNSASGSGTKETPWHMLVCIVHGAHNIEVEPEHTHFFAEIEFGEEFLWTKRVTKSINPIWEEKFSYPLDQVPTGKTMKVRVIGTDTFGTDLVSWDDINLKSVVDKKHVDRKYWMRGKGNSQIHIELQFRFGCSDIPHSWAEGILNVLIIGARYIRSEEANNLSAELEFNRTVAISRVVKDNVNPVWNQRFQFVVDEKNVNEKMKVRLYNQNVSTGKRPMGTVVDIDIKHAVRRKESNMWYQIKFLNLAVETRHFKSNPEINIVTRWTPKW